MKPLSVLLPTAVVLTAVGLLPAQDYTPPPSQPPDDATRKEIAERSDRLGNLVASLRRRGVDLGLLADVEVYHKAALWITEHDEFYQKDSARWTLEALDRGLLRAAMLGRGEAPWLQEGGHAVVRGYRSILDGSVQPYAVTFPLDYGKDLHKRWRLDVVLHGRDKSLTEVKFLHQHTDNQAAPPEQDWVQLEVYGRGNNGYRWAGERDVYEALEAFLAAERTLGRTALLDPSQVVLRGFSMGGAGTWQIGLHHPDQWSVLGPGAGFTSTHGYVKDLPNPLPPYQEACLSIYDAVNYATNAFDVPVVAYAGSDDPQLQAARNIEACLKKLDIPMTLLVAPGLGHQFPPEWQKKAEAEYARVINRGRSAYPDRVLFETYTLKYPSCFWVEIISLDQHYQRAQVDAAYKAPDAQDAGYEVKTHNVRSLHLTLPSGAAQQPVSVRIDGQQLEVRPYLNRTGTLHLYLQRHEENWRSVLPERLFTERVRRTQKVTGLQGPIDDAFMYPFLCVRGTGKPWHEATGKYAEANLKRFQEEWSKYLRGEIQVKDDVEVTPEDIIGRHLILFGDPASNSLVEQVLPGLPLEWTKEHITVADKSVDASNHVPVLIYPSPLNADRYVVLNSGHTFHAADFQGTNALLYPRLGDYALLKLSPTEKDPLATEVSTAGLFDDYWQTGRR